MDWLIENIIHGDFAWSMPLVFFMIILDIFLVHIISKKNLDIENKYYKLHLRFGYKKINFIKICFLLLYLWQASRPVRYNPASFFLSLIIYSCIVLKLLYDFVKNITAVQNKSKTG